jgi:O-methyltransferase
VSDLVVSPMRYPTFGAEPAAVIALDGDYFRVATMALALQRVHVEGIPGAVAEVGVWRGDRSILLQRVLPDRTLHLFDTFAGFPDIDPNLPGADRFQDTSDVFVRSRLPAGADVQLHPGRVPDTLASVEESQFAFVLLDLDLYEPTCASLAFFYERLSAGAYVFVHDYNNPESDWGCHRALDEFLFDKPEQPIELADEWGTAMFRCYRT